MRETAQKLPGNERRMGRSPQMRFIPTLLDLTLRGNRLHAIPGPHAEKKTARTAPIARATACRPKLSWAITRLRPAGPWGLTEGTTLTNRHKKAKNRIAKALFFAKPTQLADELSGVRGGKRSPAALAKAFSPLVPAS